MRIWKNSMVIKPNELQVGAKAYLFGEKKPYKVRCRDDRFIILTKPFNIKHTVQYTIIDLLNGIIGPDNMVFCHGYETDQDCLERLHDLQEGVSEVSRRRCLPITIADDLIPTEPIPDSAWTDKIPDGVLHGSIKISASK